MSKKDCMFQYAHKKESIFGYLSDYDIKVDTELITLDEAKELWRGNLQDFIKHLESDGDPEMALWIDCKDTSDYHTTLAHANQNTEVENKRLFNTKREYIEV